MAVPWNKGILLPTNVDNVMPGRIVVNPEIDVCGVNVAEDEINPTMTLPT